MNNINEISTNDIMKTFYIEFQANFFKINILINSGRKLETKSQANLKKLIYIRKLKATFSLPWSYPHFSQIRKKARAAKTALLIVPRGRAKNKLGGNGLERTFLIVKRCLFLMVEDFNCTHLVISKINFLLSILYSKYLLFLR